MGFNSLWRRATEVAKEAIFVEEPTTEEYALSAEQLDGCEVEGNMSETAQNMLKKAVEELDQANPENNISKVQDCIAILGEDCSPEVVRKMIQSLAKCDPDAIKKDGEARVAKITELLTVVAKNMEETLAEVTRRNDRISADENAEESSYDKDVQALNQQCEEDIQTIREKLQKDIEARAAQRDKRLEELKQQREENLREKYQAEELNREVNMRGSTLITKIQKWIAKL